MVMDLYLFLGQKIIEQPLNGSSTEINTSNFSIGVYIVKVSSNNQQIAEMKIMIRKK